MHKQRIKMRFFLPGVLSPAVMHSCISVKKIKSCRFKDTNFWSQFLNMQKKKKPSVYGEKLDIKNNMKQLRG